MRLLRGNLVIADHGSTQPWRELPSPSAGLTYWPLLPAAGTTFAAASPADSGTLSAAALLEAARGQPAAAVSVCEMGAEVREWTVRSSLLDSGPLALDFVVETEDDGSARLRFGDGTNGMQPGLGAELRVRQRTGGGTAGNIAAGSLRHVCTEDPRVAGIVQPADASGGADPEPLASARQQAPEQFRVNQRAVLPSDYEDLAMTLFPGQVTDAAAALASDGAAPAVTLHIHTGSWPGPATACGGTSATRCAGASRWGWTCGCAAPSRARSTSNLRSRSNPACRSPSSGSRSISRSRAAC